MLFSQILNHFICRKTFWTYVFDLLNSVLKTLKTEIAFNRKKCFKCMPRHWCYLHKMNFRTFLPSHTCQNYTSIPPVLNHIYCIIACMRSEMTHWMKQRYIYILYLCVYSGDPCHCLCKSFTVFGTSARVGSSHFKLCDGKYWCTSGVTWWIF